MNISSKLKAFKKDHGLYYMAMLAIPTIQFFIFYICVNFNSILLVFQRYDVNTATYVIDGFSNIKAVIEDMLSVDYLRSALLNSIYVLISNLVTLLLSAFFAFYITKKQLMSSFFKIVLFLPAIISSAALAIMFRYFSDQAIPAYLSMTGIEIVGFFSELKYYFPTMIFYSMFIGFASTILLLLGAMEGINESIIESAQLDGATPMIEFFRIIIPMIFPTLSTFVVVQVGALFTNQLNLFTFFSTGADKSIITIGYYLYAQITSAGPEAYPRLAAFGVVCTFVSIPLTFFIKWLMNKFDPYESR